MMGFWAVTWGDWATVAGILVSLVGLGWAIREARRARSASEAARSAANEAREQIAHHLQTVDLQRAIGLIERIKTLHQNELWESSTELYQSLREMLSDVIARCPASQEDLREKLTDARGIVQDIENRVRMRVSQDITHRDLFVWTEGLNHIQSVLEDLASSAGFGVSSGEAG